MLVAVMEPISKPATLFYQKVVMGCDRHFDGIGFLVFKVRFESAAAGVAIAEVLVNRYGTRHSARSPESV